MKTQSLHIPSGYKPSPLGIIPEDWEVKRVKDVSTIKGRIGYRGYTVEDIVNDGNGAISLSPSNIVDGKLQFNSVTSITWEKYYESPEIMLCNGDIVMVKTGSSFGKVAFVDNLPQEATINPQFVIINNIKCDNKWLCYLFDSDCIQKNVHKIVVGGAIPTMSQEEIANFKIAVPPLPEQHRIVSVLSLWDTAIAKQTALIEQLTLRKRGLMQQLLTGKKRLKGFEGEWEYHRMKEHFELILDKNDGKGHTPMTISAKCGLISQKNKFDRIVAGNSLDKYTLLKKGDFAYNKGNSNLFEMGCIYRLEECSAVVPFVYICFRASDNTCCEFYQHFFINHGLDKQLKKIITSGARGDGLLNVNDKDFMMLKIPYPQIAEQRAIASILDNADKEIELAKKRLLHLQKQKQGLMQVLLSGKRRI